MLDRRLAHYQSDEANEDMGDMMGGGWSVTLYVRPASAEAAEKVLAAEAVKTGAAAKEAARAAAVKELIAVVCTKENSLPEEKAFQPEGQKIVIREGAHGSGVEAAFLRADGSVAVWHSGYYDNYRSSLWVTSDARAVELTTKLLAG